MFTYKAIEADPVRVRLAARAALHLESVEVGVFLGVRGLEVGNPVLKSQKNLSKAYCSFEHVHVAGNRSFFFSAMVGENPDNRDPGIKNWEYLIYIPLQLSLKDQ